MDRRSFLKAGSLFAAGLPLGCAGAGVGAGEKAAKWQKPVPPFPPNEEWPNEAWETAYRPDEFVYVKPSVQLVGDRAVAIFWKSREIAYGWAEVSQDGGATWVKVWTDVDGIRDVNVRTHAAVFEDYDPGKPLRFRAFTRPIAEASCWGNVRFVGETLPEKALSGYYIDAKAYKALVKARAERYSGVEFTDGGEVGPLVGKTLDILMFNDVHHGIVNYPKLLDRLGLKRAGLAVFAGDICDHARSETDYDKHLDAPMAYLTERLGAVTRFVRGNHETMGLYSRQVREHMALQDNNQYGAVTLGDTRLLFLDTGNDAQDEDNPNAWTQNFFGMKPYFAREGAWLRRELASSAWKNAKRRLVFSHIPPTYARYRAGATITRELFDPLKAANVTLYAAGHIHDGAYIPAAPERPYPLAIGGGPYAKRNPRENCIATVTHLAVAPEAVGVRQIDLDGNEVFNEKIPM